METNEMEVRIIAVAKEIGTVQELLANCRVSSSQMQSDLEARKLFITPPEGWEGKNEGERKITAELTFSKDKTISTIRDNLTGMLVSLANTEANLAKLEAERRGYEWVITNQLVNALHERWDGLNPGRILAQKLPVNRAREEVLDQLDDGLPTYLDGVKRSGDATLTSAEPEEDLPF